MTIELVYRMRTCSAALLDCKGAPSEYLIGDAVELLVEASNQLDLSEPLAEPLGEPMEKLKAVGKQIYAGDAVWTAPGELPPAVPRPCPSCGNIAARTVRIINRKLLLTCPMCTHQWEYAA